MSLVQSDGERYRVLEPVRLFAAAEHLSPQQMERLQKEVEQLSPQTVIEQIERQIAGTDPF